MRGAHRQTQPRLPSRHGRIAYRRNKNSLFAQGGRRRDRPDLVSHEQRDDGAADRRKGKTGGNKSVFHLLNPGPKLVASRLTLIGLNEMNRRSGGSRGGPDRRGRTN